MFKHPWVSGSSKSTEPELELPMAQVVQTHIIPAEENIDPDVFRHMNNLGCFKDKDRLVAELLSPKHNTEKMVYFLLLDRKRRKPAQEDETEVVLRGSSLLNVDPPRKRTDTSKPRLLLGSDISEGSPVNPRKGYGRYAASTATSTAAGRNRHSSLGGSPTGSPKSSPRNFYNSRGNAPPPLNLDGASAAIAALASARQASTISMGGGGGGSVSARSTINATSSTTYSHYYTQPMPDQANRQQARTSRRDQFTFTQFGVVTPTPSTGNRGPPPPLTHKNSTPDSLMGASSAASSSNSLASGGSATNVNNAMSSSSISSASATPGVPWRSKLGALKSSFLGTPRFHRRKFSGGNNPTAMNSAGSMESDSEESSMLDTNDLVKKSWFGSLTSNIGADRDDVQCVPVEEKSLNEIKAELIRSFLTIHELSHSVVGQNSFRVEYKRGPSMGGSVFSRGIKMQVDILCTERSGNAEHPFYVVQFTLHTGPVRRFRRLVEHLSSILQSTQQRAERISGAPIPAVGASNNPTSSNSTAPTTATPSNFMVRPRRLSDSSVSSACSAGESETGIAALHPHQKRSQQERGGESGISLAFNSTPPTLLPGRSTAPTSGDSLLTPPIHSANTSKNVLMAAVRTHPAPTAAGDLKSPGSLCSLLNVPSSNEGQQQLLLNRNAARRNTAGPTAQFQWPSQASPSLLHRNARPTATSMRNPVTVDVGGWQHGSASAVRQAAVRTGSVKLTSGGREGCSINNIDVLRSIFGEKISSQRPLHNPSPTTASAAVDDVQGPAGGKALFSTTKQQTIAGERKVSEPGPGALRMDGN